MFYATTLGKAFAKTCKNGDMGRVHSIFERAVNIRLEGQAGGLLTMLCSEIDILPAYLITHAPGGSWGRLMQVNDSLLFTGEAIYIRNEPIIGQITQAKLWERLSDAELTAHIKPEIDLIILGCKLAESYLSKNSPPSISFPVMPQPLNPLELIGLGPGLTPSGDDFLAGVLHGMIFMEKLRGIKNPRLPEITQLITNNLHKTGEISRHFLSYAVAGEWGRNTEDFLIAITENETRKLQNAIDRKLSIGATSGADEIRGCIYGVLAGCR